MARRKNRRALGALGELAHEGRIFVGRNVNDPQTGNKLRELSRKEIDRMAEYVSKETTGAVTVSRGTGIYSSIDTGQVWPQEKTSVFTSIVPATGNAGASCTRMVRRLRRAGARLAQKGKQQSVLVEVRCATGNTDAALVTASGKVERLFPLKRGKKRVTPHS
jgi:hypothetical protein